ncbi:hypothetical protein DID88_008045 [Monilinia fructigena]|uniref:Uncharacterized protein n=1 Tax=Monilinia fructigena TaxID=38457 RepID=A0A395J4K6_9HELO|nr:hypothetical protein DID88_008045 [Monilinia fructigena]
MPFQQHEFPSFAITGPLPILCAAFSSLPPELQASGEAALQRLFGHIRLCPTPEGRILWLNSLYASGFAAPVDFDAY